MADSKLTALSEDTAPTGDDILYIVNDPGGSPLQRKVALNSILARIITKTSSGTLVAADVLGPHIIHNDGAIAEVILTWLTLVTGQGAFFYVNDAQYLQIKAPAATTIRHGANTSPAAGYIRSNTVGNWIYIKAMPDGLVAFQTGGLWELSE